MEANIKFLQTAPQPLIENWFLETDKAYYSGESGLSDQEYDVLLNLYETRFGPRKVIGYSQDKESVKLPIAMMSLNKAKTDKGLQRFTDKNNDKKVSYVITDKVNGNAALLHNGKLYNRGDGNMGSDLSYLIPYLDLYNSSDHSSQEAKEKCLVFAKDNFIKGEIVIDKKSYFSYVNGNSNGNSNENSNENTNNKTDNIELGPILAFTSGLLNCKSAPAEKYRLLKFVAYDIINKEEDNNMSENLEKLKKVGFHVPFSVIIESENINVETLKPIFETRKIEASYDIDGLVICSDRKTSYSEKLKLENPNYMIAFKTYTNACEVIVERVEWKTSKNKLLKPRIIITPVKLNGFEIKSLTAFNAGWIRDNKVGKDSVLLITHNIIPYILEVLESSQADLPEQEGEGEGKETWTWNSTGVDIELLEENSDVKMAKMYEFFKQICAKYWGESVIHNLYQSGFTCISDILESSEKDLLEKAKKGEIQGIAETGMIRLINSLNSALQNVTLAQIMSASCVFGFGFAVKKCELILEAYPDVLTRNITLQDLTNVKGFADKTAERFLEGLPKFKIFLEENQRLKNLLDVNPNKIRNVIQLNLISNSQLLSKTSSNLPKLLSKTSIENFPIILSTVETKNIKNTVEKESQTSIYSSDPVYNGGESLEKLTVVFTGFRDKQIERIVKDRGGKIGTSVSKNTTCVVVSSVNTGKNITSKEKTAKEKNIPIYTLEEFRKKYKV